MNTKMLFNFIFLICSILMFDCAMPGMPGYVSETTSNFDNSRQITIEPAWLYNSPIKLSLTKTSKMPDSTIVLDAVVQGAYNFSQGPSLNFNIDGEIFSFESIDAMTDINTTSGVYNSVAYISPSNWSSKRYIITKSFLNKLINGKRVWVKIDLSKVFVEGEFSSDAPTTARPAFQDFLSRINKWK